MNNKRFDSLDGLRLYAIYMILASHTGAFKLYVGGTMVDLFFVISGFVAVAPLRYDIEFEKQFTSPKNWIKYYLKRIIRIFPIYWLVVLFGYFTGIFAPSEGCSLLSNLLMIRVDYHLWFIQNLCVIYLIIPAVILMTYLVKMLHDSNLLCAGIILILAFVADYVFNTLKIFTLYGNAAEQYLRLSLVMIGMSAGYIVKGLKGYDIEKRTISIVIDIVILAIMAFLVFSVPYYFERLGIQRLAGILIGWTYPKTISLISAVLVILLTINEKGLVAKILTLPVVKDLGEVSFGIYLIHFFFLGTQSTPTPEKKWLLIIVVSSGIAYMMYHLFEKKLVKLARPLIDKI